MYMFFLSMYTSLEIDNLGGDKAQMHSLSSTDEYLDELVPY